MTRRGSAGLGVMALATVLLLTAVAGGKVVQRDFVIGGFDTPTKTALCPQGKKPASGGFLFEKTFGDLELRESRPTRKGWAVEVQNSDATPRAGRVVVVCQGAKGLTLRSKTRVVPSDATNVQVIASCPRGSHAIGGGGQIVGGGTAVPIGSFPAGGGRTWGSRWWLPGERATKLKAYAVCDARVRGYDVVTEDTDVNTRQRGGAANAFATATCKGRDKLLGGGYFRGLVNDGPSTNLESRPAAGGWRVGIRGRAGPPVLSFAVCGR